LPRNACKQAAPVVKHEHFKRKRYLSWIAIFERPAFDEFFNSQAGSTPLPGGSAPAFHHPFGWSAIARFAAVPPQIRTVASAVVGLVFLFFITVILIRFKEV